jgi:hypothetical protein
MFVIARAPEFRGRWVGGDRSQRLAEIARLNSNYFFELRRDLADLNYRRALETDTEARMYMFVYGERLHEMYRRYGLDAFYSGTTYAILLQVPDLIQEAIESCAGFEKKNCIGGEAPNEAKMPHA